MFDLEKIKAESGLSSEQLARLEEEIKDEFQDDEMMIELHLLRTLQALEMGWLTIDQIFLDVPVQINSAA